MFSGAEHLTGPCLPVCLEALRPTNSVPTELASVVIIHKTMFGQKPGNPSIEREASLGLLTVLPCTGHVPPSYSPLFLAHFAWEWQLLGGVHEGRESTHWYKLKRYRLAILL